jgi:hypothetical protein
LNLYINENNEKRKKKRKKINEKKNEKDYEIISLYSFLFLCLIGNSYYFSLGKIIKVYIKFLKFLTKYYNIEIFLILLENQILLYWFFNQNLEIWTFSKFFG